LEYQGVPAGHGCERYQGVEHGPSRPDDPQDVLPQTAEYVDLRRQSLGRLEVDRDDVVPLAGVERQAAGGVEERARQVDDVVAGGTLDHEDVAVTGIFLPVNAAREGGPAGHLEEVVTAASVDVFDLFEDERALDGRFDGRPYGVRCHRRLVEAAFD